jgi:hypothetical protein
VTIALFLCLPAILGTFGTILPLFLAQGDSWPTHTVWDRLLIEVYTWSIVVATTSPFSTLAAIPATLFAVKRAGLRSGLARLAYGALLVAVTSSVWFFLWFRGPRRLV